MGIDPRSRRLVYSDNPTPWCHKILKRAPRRPRKTNRSPPRDRTPRSAVLARWAHIEHHNPDRRGLDQRLALGASTSRSPMRADARHRGGPTGEGLDQRLAPSRRLGARHLGAPVGRGRRCCRAWPGGSSSRCPRGTRPEVLSGVARGSSSRCPRGTRPEVLSGVARGLVISAPPWDAAGGVVGRGQGARHLGAPVGRGRRCCRAWPGGSSSRRPRGTRPEVLSGVAKGGSSPRRPRGTRCQARFAPVRARFAPVQARFAPVRARFAPVRARVAPVRVRVARRSEGGRRLADGPPKSFGMRRSNRI